MRINGDQWEHWDNSIILDMLGYLYADIYVTDTTKDRTLKMSTVPWEFPLECNPISNFSRIP